ncbi:MAG TPA: hypothetical protein VJ824_05185 [Bacillota bacterium]|nr:hypothetical protein [Bacillota bacterium]
MKEAIRIVKEIKELESQLERLKADLHQLQATCEHVYENNVLVSTCVKCRKTESNYY